jgi:hypothetical protein
MFSVAVPARALPTPIVASNLELLTSFPDVGAISTAFAKSAPQMFVNTLNGVSAYDISTPESPRLLGQLVLPHFENERMTLGERHGGRERFLLIGLDLYGVTPTDPTNVNVGGYELIIVDVTDPTNPVVRGRTATTTSVHTVHCIDRDCTHAYSAGAYDNGRFSVFDLRDLDNPTEVKVTRSVAGSGHQWDYDDSGLLWHSGFDGIAAYDVSDPLNPVPVASTDENGTKTPYNDFILHNSFHPFAQSFTQARDASGRLSSGPPSLTGGNILLATEEDYDNPVCPGDAGEGTFSTWHIPYLDAAQFAADNPAGTPGKGAITPLDHWNTEILDTGVGTVAGAFCSAHYFTVNDEGFVAQAWYQQGTRILDVRDPSDIKQVGYFFTGAMETWIPYFVPRYSAKGKMTGQMTDIIYTNDVVRGIDVLRFTPPTTAPQSTTDLTAPILSSWLTGATTAATLPSEEYGYLCRLS